MKINEGFLAQMRDVMQVLKSDGPTAATAAIQRALQGGAPDTGARKPEAAPFQRQSPEMRDINPPPPVTEKAAATAKDLLSRLKRAYAKTRPAPSDQPAGDAVRPDEKGQFLSGSLTNRAGTRAYKLYVPSSWTEKSGKSYPLVVMLHGCKQNPDDFAAGTGMNGIAEADNCFVVYPGQVHSANGSNCWNWFKPQDQQRDNGEPSLIADIVRDLIRTHNIDPKRVYVAGLSAGGAMAAVLGATYPDLFAAVGVHSGLPWGAAHDVPSAFSAMQGGKGMTGLPGMAAKPVAPLEHQVPVIVFHGDRDTTVNPANGEGVLSQYLPQAAGGNANGGGIGQKTEQGTAPNGRSFTRQIYQDGKGRAVAEHWVVHGAPHAWSGGHRSGSYTDPAGPNASREMLRFFLSHTRKAA